MRVGDVRETIAKRVLILIFFNTLFYRFDGIFITKGILTFTCAYVSMIVRARMCVCEFIIFGFEWFLINSAFIIIFQSVQTYPPKCANQSESSTFQSYNFSLKFLNWKRQQIRGSWSFQDTSNSFCSVIQNWIVSVLSINKSKTSQNKF